MVIGAYQKPVRLSWVMGIFSQLLSVSLVFADSPFYSGEMAVTRVPRDYWVHRLKLAKAMGLTTISTYVFWSQHEPVPGSFEWSGEKDIAEFCRYAQKEGMQVLIRPGPYVCGEFDFGGMPWWLLKDRNMRVRSRYSGYIESVRRYYKALG